MKKTEPTYGELLIEAVRGWERGARVPDGPSLRLLEIAERHPEAVLDKLAS